MTIVENPDYGKTLEMVRALDPAIVIPGAEILLNIKRFLIETSRQGVCEEVTGAKA